MPEPAVRRPFYQTWQFWVKVAITAAILTWLLGRISLGDMLSVLGTTRPGYLLLALLASNVTMAAAALRWYRLLAALSIRVPYLHILRHVYVCLFFNVFVPGGVAGEVVRTLALARSRADDNDVDSELGSAAASVAADRVAGLLALLGLAVTGILLWFGSILDPAVFKSIKVFAGILLAIGCFVMTGPGQRFLLRLVDRFLVRVPRLAAVSKQFIGVCRTYRKRPLVLLEALVLSVIAHLFSIARYYLVARALSLDVGYLTMVTFVPIIVTLSCLPITVGGIGVRETVSLLLFQQVNIAQEPALAIALLAFCTQLATALIGGGVYLAPGHRRLAEGEAADGASPPPTSGEQPVP
jgi:uncharacterized protein (TIRG00374 family)